MREQSRVLEHVGTIGGVDDTATLTGAPGDLPEQVEGPMLHLANHYETQRRWFFGFFLATLIISVSKDLVINRHWPSAVNLGFHAFLAAVCVSAIIVRRRRYQEVVGVTCAAAMATYIGLLFTRLR